MTRTVDATPAIALTLMVALPALAVAQTTQPRMPGTQRAETARPGKVVAQPSKTSARILPQGFSVVLVLADLQASGGQDDVPPAARKALMDMKDFLPYKSYRLLDAAWLLGQGTSLNRTLLRGLDEQEYELRLHAQPTSSPGDSSRVFVRFTLNDSGTHGQFAAAASSDRARERAAELEQRTAALRDELKRAQLELERKRQSKGAAGEDLQAAESEYRRLQSELAARQAQASRRGAYAAATPRPDRAVIDTSFAMEVGETVVVGTSRLKGNGKALIALLTAVPPKGKS